MAYIDVVKREFKRFYPRPLAWIVTFIFPLLMCLIICLIFGKATPRDLPIAVWNADNSNLSRMLVRNLNAMPSCKVKYQVTSSEEGKQLLTEGKIYGFVVIPKNFQRDIYRFQQPQIAFYYNNQRILIGGIVSKDVTTLMQSMIVGFDAKIKSQKGMPFDEALRQSNLINVVEHVRSNPYFNYQYFLSLIAFGHILQISMVMASVWAIGTEFKKGTTKEWLKEADNSILVAFFGKLTPYFIVFSLLFAIIYIVYFGFYQAPYNGNVLCGIFATAIFIISCLCLSAIFISINGNCRYCLSASAFYTAMGFALAGITFPVMAMPWIARAYNLTMPLTYWIKVMLDQSVRDVPPLYDFLPMLIGVSIIFISLCFLPRLKNLANDENRWFQS